FAADKTVYLLTRFIEGGDLFYFLRKDRLSERVAQCLFRQLIRGIQYVHEKHICHLDLSPENVLINLAGDEVYIIDFGMCVKMPLDQHGHSHGNRLFLEQYYATAAVRYCRFACLLPSLLTLYLCASMMPTRMPYDGVAVDTFTLGACLWTMLTGRRAWGEPIPRDPGFQYLVEMGDVQGLLAAYRMESLSSDVSLGKRGT
ncbi:unnamed protein product, partial [Discosporangium mesarthrocarpum]